MRAFLPLAAASNIVMVADGILEQLTPRLVVRWCIATEERIDRWFSVSLYES
jgi:uncharacterized protein YjeT (DUF2065 family)